MKKNTQFVSSLEKISLTRKFAVLFMLMSVLPFAPIAYLLYHYLYGLEIDETFLLILSSAAGIGLIAGFYGMRTSLANIRRLSSEAAKALSKNIPSLSGQDEESEVAQLSRTFSEVTRSLEQTIRRLESSKQTMQNVLSKLAVAISTSHTIDTFLELIIEITTNALDSRVGVLMLLDEEKQELSVKIASGVKEDFRNTRLKVGEDIPGLVAKQREALMKPLAQKSEPSQKGIFRPPLMAAPMLYKDKLVGVLVVAEKVSTSGFDEDEQFIISNLAAQTAAALENERLNLDAERTYLETITALAMAVEARDPYSRGHSDRVAEYSVKIAQKLSLDPELIKEIRHAGVLHDVGKIGISDDVLKKPDKLNDDEWQLMRKHPIIGEEIVSPVRCLSKICSGIRYHHEWLDGTGYPDRLKAQEIPLTAKILSVADSFDAMTTDRPYRKGLSFDIAKSELKKYIDIRYDREVVEAFLSII